MVRFPWSRRMQPYSEGDKVRQGTGPRDNLVVLVVSLGLLAVVGVWLAYWFYGAAG